MTHRPQPQVRHGLGRAHTGAPRDTGFDITSASEIMSVIAVFVGGFLVFVTFSVAVAERTQTFGILRATGARPSQVLRVVLVEAAALGFVASLVGLALAYPSGALVDRYGRKAVIVPATMLSGASMVMFPYAPSYAWFLLACVAWSVASGVSGAAPAAYAADVAPPGMNAAAMSMYRMLGDLGYVVGPVALGASTDLFGANATLIVSLSCGSSVPSG
jgi:MFS family permease